MIKAIQELLSIPKNIRQLCDEIDCQAKETVTSIKKNGVALDPLRPRDKK